MSVTPVLAALRQATSADHERLDRDIRFHERVRDASARLDLVAAFRRFHGSAERLFDGVLAEGEARPAPRLARIDADLAALTTSPAPALDPLRANHGEALGWAYVVEGSSLGGRVLTRELSSEGVDLTGLGFLDPHGADVGPRWKALVAAIEDEVASGRATVDQVVAGARSAFAYAHSVLAAAPPSCEAA